VRLLDAPAKSAPEETRARILAAAREIFALKGTRGTTTREVADRAGVNEATVFRHFGTKQALLHDMLEQYCGGGRDLESLFETLTGSLEERLRTLGHASIERIKLREDLIRVSLAEQVTDPDASTLTWRGPQDAHALLRDFMRERVEAGELRGDPAAMARIFMSLFFAYVFARKVWEDGRGDTPAARDEAVRACVELFLHGARSI
jgi:AcrR family transcriptional regulator